MDAPPTSTDSTIWQACLLALVGGYADAVGFLTFGAFAGAMTGNAVLLGIALAGNKVAEAVQSAGIIASFLVGVAASAFLRRFTTLAGLLCLEMAAIILAALVTSFAAATTLAFAMGLQSAAMTRFAGRSVSSTVFLTGNLQQFVQTLLQRDARDRASEHKTTVLVGALGGLSRRGHCGRRGLALDEAPPAVRSRAAAPGAAAPIDMAQRVLTLPPSGAISAPRPRSSAG